MPYYTKPPRRKTDLKNTLRRFLEPMLDWLVLIATGLAFILAIMNPTLLNIILFAVLAAAVLALILQAC